MKKIFCLFLILAFSSCSNDDVILPDDYPPPPDKVKDVKDPIVVNPSDYQIG